MAQLSCTALMQREADDVYRPPPSYSGALVLTCSFGPYLQLQFLSAA